MKLLLALFLALALPLFQPLHADDDRYPKLSPFEALDWKESTPRVQVGGDWYVLVKLDGVEAARIVGFCQKEFGSRWQKRFGEDLVQALRMMGEDPGRFVSLELRDERGQTRTMKRVEMTEANRRAIWAAAKGRSPAPRPPATLALGAEQLAEDLVQVERLIEGHYAYRDRNQAPWRPALDGLRERVRGGMTLHDFELELVRFLALFGDGHTRTGTRLPDGYAAFLPAWFDDRLYAFRADRRGLLDDEHPLLAEIDGVAIERWLAAAGRYAAQGSVTFHRRHATRNLRHIAFLRDELELPGADRVVLTLTSADGKRRRELELALGDRKPIYGDWPRTEHGVLDGNIGYLRITDMDDDGAFLNGLVEAMERFRDTKGLVIDVRGNGGGTRDALRLLAPYFMPPREKAWVANVARFRRRADQSADEPEGYLANRYLYPLASERWNADERRAIERFAKRFEPSWPVDEAEFSGWHYMVLTRDANRDAYAYGKPVVVLQDDGCFSATDIFLGALQGRKNVTLMGRTSGGGSGRSLGYDLRHSGVRLRLSSMASYRPDGRIYEGLGIEPDVVVEPLPTDFTGATDSLLDAALERLR